MGFKSYATHSLPDGSLLLDDPQPLVLSGRKGLIAKYVLAMPQDASERWVLLPPKLLALTPSAPEAHRRLIVFEQAEASKLELMALESIHGTSETQTEMLFTFRPLIAVTRDGSPPAWRLNPDKIYSEGLLLEGGILAPLATWRWGQPHLALGGVVCGGGATATP